MSSGYHFSEAEILSLGGHFRDMGRGRAGRGCHKALLANWDGLEEKTWMIIKCSQKQRHWPILTGIRQKKKKKLIPQITWMNWKFLAASFCRCWKLAQSQGLIEQVHGTGTNLKQLKRYHLHYKTKQLCGRAPDYLKAERVFGKNSMICFCSSTIPPWGSASEHCQRSSWIFASATVFLDIF